MVLAAPYQLDEMNILERPLPAIVREKLADSGEGHY
jgi:hypothetical protein